SITPQAEIEPDLSILLSNNSICSGQSMTFTAHSGNSTLSNYQWKLNGTNVGTGSSYTTTNFTSSSVVTLRADATYSGTCLSPTTENILATTAGMPITVTTTVTPSVSLSASDTSICTGESV